MPTVAPTAAEVRKAEWDLALHHARQDPDTFVELVARDQGGEPIHQAELHTVMQRHVSFAWDHQQHSVVVGPPEFGKSVQMLMRLIWEIGVDPNLRIGIVAGNYLLGIQKVQTMRNLLVESADIHAVFPGLRQARPPRGAARDWAKSRFMVARDGTAIDPSVQALAPEGTIESVRLDRLWLDDYVTRKDWTSEAERKSRIQGWGLTWSRRLGARGLACITNNAWHKEDLIHSWRAAEKTRYCIVWAGIPDSCDRMEVQVFHADRDEYEATVLAGLDFQFIPEDSGAAFAFSLPLWHHVDERGVETGWARERLLVDFKENPLSFRRSFGGKAVDISNMTFPPVEKWATYDTIPREDGKPAETIADLLRCVPDYTHAPVIGFLDPSGGEGKGDYAAVGALAFIQARYWLIHVMMSQTMAPLEVVRYLFALSEMVKAARPSTGLGIHVMGIETNFAQKLYLTVIAQVAQELRLAGQPADLAVRGVDVKDKKELRILGLQPKIVTGAIVVPEHAARLWPTMFSQFEAYGPDSKPQHDDGPDMLASCVMLAGASPTGFDVKSSRVERTPFTSGGVEF